MTVTNLSNGSIILFLCPSFLEQLVYDKGINFQRPSNGRCPASGRSGGHEADDHRSAITEQATQGYTHIPMSVEEASAYLKMPMATLYMKLGNGSIPATKPGKRYCLYQDELDKWLETNRKNPVPLTAEEENAAILAGNKRKPKPLNW